MGKSKVGAIMVRMRMEGMIHADIWGKTIQRRTGKAQLVGEIARRLMYVQHTK